LRLGPGFLLIKKQLNRAEQLRRLALEILPNYV